MTTQWSLVECDAGKCRYKCAFCPVVTSPTANPPERISCNCRPPPGKLEYAAVSARFAIAIAASYGGKFKCDKPGTCLAEMLGWIVPAYVTAGGCGSCPKRAEEMDAAGAEWCAANVETIVGWLKDNSAKLYLPFNERAATVLVHRAIALSLKR